MPRLVEALDLDLGGGSDLAGATSEDAGVLRLSATQPIRVAEEMLSLVIQQPWLSVRSGVVLTDAAYSCAG